MMSCCTHQPTACQYPAAAIPEFLFVHAPQHDSPLFLWAKPQRDCIHWRFSSPLHYLSLYSLCEEDHLMIFLILTHFPWVSPSNSIKVVARDHWKMPFHETSRTDNSLTVVAWIWEQEGMWGNIEWGAQYGISTWCFRLGKGCATWKHTNCCWIANFKSINANSTLYKLYFNV